MSGQVYILPVGSTITSAWEKIYGAKKTFWAALGLLFVIMFSIGFLEGLTEPLSIVSGALKVIGNILGYFLQLGLIYIGIKHAKDMPINYKMLFAVFHLDYILRLVGLYILQTLIFIAPILIGALGIFLFILGNAITMTLGILLCITAFIVMVILAIRLSMSMAYVLDMKSSPLAAIKNSFTATRENFWNLLGIFLLQVLIVLVSIIPLGIGLIWSIPFLFTCYGLIYKQLSVNVQSPVLAEKH